MGWTFSVLKGHIFVMKIQQDRVDVFIGLGANLGEAERTVRAAITALGELPETERVAASSLYRTAPVGYLDQPDFINAVVWLRTALSAEALLHAIQALELQAGRERSFQDAPRTLDLDVLLYGQQQMDTPNLSVPHPRMHQRGFVLIPLAEIAPDLSIPGQGAVQHLIAALPETEKLQGVIKI